LAKSGLSAEVQKEEWNQSKQFIF